MSANRGAWRTAVLAIAVGGLVLTGCKRLQASGKPPLSEVAVVVVKTEPAEITVELPGRTSPFLVADVRPQVSGIILKRLFDEGADVKADAVLYQIDPAMYQAASDSAQAALAKAEAQLRPLLSRAARYKELIVIKAVSQQDYDDILANCEQAKAEIEACKAAVETARINLAYTLVKAPAAGRIGRSSVTVGALVTANQPTALATIQQLDPIYVDVPQSTTELLRLKRRLEAGHLNHDAANQNQVKLLLEDGTAYPAEGALQFRDVSVDPTTGSVIIRMVFPNPDGVLLPGMFVRAVVKEGVNAQAILIPQQAVSRDPKGNPLALIVNASGKVEQRMLSLDRAIGDRWLVSTGLAPGDRVIVEGMQKVRPGAEVKATPFDDGRKQPVHAAQPASTSN
jgi:membrane fusion protein (multidrug efflux system)